MFLGIISYVIGIFMENVIPRYGWFRYLNPVRTSYSRPYRRCTTLLRRALSTKKRMRS